MIVDGRMDNRVIHGSGVGSVQLIGHYRRWVPKSEKGMIVIEGLAVERDGRIQSRRGVRGL